MTLKKLTNFIINVFLIPLVVIGILGATSELLGLITNATYPSILLIDVVFIMSILMYWLWPYKNSIWNRANLLISNKYLIFLVTIFIIIWQIYLVITVSNLSGWDPGIIAMKATGMKPWAWVGLNYFSNYPNIFFC